jgi:transcription initiation factor TFIIH subunit 3
MDILTLSSFSHPEFLQQAADATGGVYMALGHEIHGLLQVLMMAYLPDSTARKTLVTAGETEGVDFRAACFCHRNVVDLGYVCSVCLSSMFFLPFSLSLSILPLPPCFPAKETTH